MSPPSVPARIRRSLLADMVDPGGWPNDWSPDGRYVLWFGGDGLWLVPATGRGEPVQVSAGAVQPALRAVLAAFRTLAEWALDRLLRHGVGERRGVRAVVSGRSPLHGVNAGGAAPGWRKDGRELFYVATDGRLTAVRDAARNVD